MRYLLVLVLCMVAWGSAAEESPKNSHRNPLGSGWQCNRGYAKEGGECTKVIIPQNAVLDVYGSGWSCKRGYRKEDGGCLKVQVPKNAEIDVYGSGWSCKRGYFKSENGCVKVEIPTNATLDVYGSGWSCKRGYFKSENGCTKVEMPPNAELDVYGSGWTCKKGFKTVAGVCAKMSVAEAQQQKDLEQKFRREIQRRRAQVMSQGNCELEYRSGSEVCVLALDAGLDCNEDYTGSQYRECTASISYEIDTNYRGQSNIDAEVECSIEIEYQGREIYRRTATEEESESHTLFANGSDSNSMDIDFSFSSYEEVTKAKITSATCSVSNVFLY